MKFFQLLSLKKRICRKAKTGKTVAKELRTKQVPLLTMLLLVFAASGSAQIGPSEAVRMEILYSMRQNWNAYWPNIPVDANYYQTIGSTTHYLSNWNYLDSDPNTVMDVVNRSGGYFTSGRAINSYWPLQSYGLQKPSNWPTSIGRGGQCPWYATTIYQRSGTRRFTWSYNRLSNLAAQFNWIAVDGQRGDIIFKKNVHVAIIFEVHSNGFWIAESNYFRSNETAWLVKGANAGPASEVISMRWVPRTSFSGWQRLPVNQAWRL